MARIPDDEIGRLKAEVSLQRLAERRGIALRRHGSDLLGLCPFHDEHEPSPVISPAKNLWHCLGACGAGGSVIDWVMRTEGISFRHAVELLRADLPGGTGTGRAPGRSVTRKLAPPVERDAADAEVLAQVVAYYHETLKQSPEAQAYLASAVSTRPSWWSTSTSASPTAPWATACRIRPPWTAAPCALAWPAWG